MSFLPDHAKRFVAAWTRHEVGKDAWQNKPEIIRNAAFTLCAEQTVFEMFFFVREHFLLFAEKFCPGKPSAQRDENHEHNRADPKEAFRFWGKTDWFVARVLIKMFSDIPRLRLSPAQKASFHIPILRGRHLNYLRSDHARSRAARFHLRVEPEIFLWILGFIFAAPFVVESGDVGNKSDLRLVERIVAAIENSRSFRAGIKQIAQCRHRPVVQIRRAQPDTIERQVCVSESFSEMTETPRITGIEIVLRHGQFFGVGIEPVTVGGDFIDRHNVADVFAAEIAAIASVATRAVLRVKFFALRAGLRMDRGTDIWAVP